MNDEERERGEEGEINKKINFSELNHDIIDLIAGQLENLRDLRSFHDTNRFTKTVVEYDEYLERLKTISDNFEYISPGISFTDNSISDVEIKNRETGEIFHNFKTGLKIIYDLSNENLIISNDVYIDYYGKKGMINLDEDESIRYDEYLIKVDKSIIKYKLMKMIKFDRSAYQNYILLIWDKFILVIANESGFRYRKVFENPIKSCVILNDLTETVLTDTEGDHFLPTHRRLIDNQENLIFYRNDKFIIMSIRGKNLFNDTHFCYLHQKDDRILSYNINMHFIPQFEREILFEMVRNNKFDDNKILQIFEASKSRLKRYIDV
jgi:hypothetical protein